jgi:hypothetical protein
MTSKEKLPQLTKSISYIQNSAMQFAMQLAHAVFYFSNLQGFSYTS